MAHPGVHYTSQNIVVCERGLRVPKHVISCLYHLLDTFDLRSACCAQCVSMGSPARCLSIGRVHGISTRPHLFALVVASIARVWGRAPLVVAGRPWLWPPTTSSAAGVERTSKMSEQRVVGSTSLLLKPSRVYCCAFSCILSPPGRMLVDRCCQGGHHNLRIALITLPCAPAGESRSFPPLAAVSSYRLCVGSPPSVSPADWRYELPISLHIASIRRRSSAAELDNSDVARFS